MTTQQHTDAGRILVFVFRGRSRPWTTLDGSVPPADSFWEASAFPSNEYAIGTTWEEAKESLRNLIEREIASAGVDVYTWYREQLSHLNAADRQVVGLAALKFIEGSSDLYDACLGDRQSHILDEIENGAEGEHREDAPCAGMN